jgi:hypothetical protein
MVVVDLDLAQGRYGAGNAGALNQENDITLFQILDDELCARWDSPAIEGTARKTLP